MPPQGMSGGFTVVELLVAIGLFGVIVAIAMGGFARALRTERQVTALVAANTNVSVVLEEMARELRTGLDFCIGGCISPEERRELRFVNGRGEEVFYRLENDAVVREMAGGVRGAERLTSANVAVQGLFFLLTGHESGDGYPARVTILLAVSPKSADPALRDNVIYLQTTVSARALDPSL
ncbi:MAG: prepilin-type N-terminal cleavage/methylation domain-containing protein [Candidatus Liptonbacteria bacterium]|nr:prepilin-type N-terminal cleavage/methylation domain-containing protein [Candidatus Liptonbacteria bacterium]